jgi:ribosome-binding factor A
MMKRDSDSRPAGPSQRQLRVGELIRHAVTEILSRGELPEDVFAKAFVTIPEVRMSPDLKLATVYVTLHDEKLSKPVLKAFEQNRKAIRTDVARKVNLKFAPDVRFRLDDRLEEVDRIEALLRSPKVRRDLDTPARDLLAGEAGPDDDEADAAEPRRS